MLQEERYQDILSYLTEHKQATVKELCNLMHASSSTIRRDLSILEKRGLLSRSFGGAAINDIFPSQMPLSVRTDASISEKKKLAAKAAKLITPGDTIFVDASSTTYFLLQYLCDIPDLTVVTNNPYLSLGLAEHKIRGFSTGGEMLNDSVCFCGRRAEQFVRSMRANLFFFSSRGFDDNIITDSSKDECDIKRTMIECSRKQVFLASEEKSGNTYPFVIAQMQDISYIIRSGPQSATPPHPTNAARRPQSIQRSPAAPSGKRDPEAHPSRRRTSHEE